LWGLGICLRLRRECEEREQRDSEPVLRGRDQGEMDAFAS